MRLALACGIALGLYWTCAATATAAMPIYEKDNGVIKIRMGESDSPIITGMWIGGVRVVPHDNIGADFQMATRSDLGDAYNPTQGGDCAGNPSILSGVIPNWNGAMLGTPAANGILFGIDPRNYNEPSYPGCLGMGAVLPYDFNFGVTLGDGHAIPKEMMVLDMSVRRESGSQELIKALSELPVAFFDNAQLPYAYYSDDATPADGMQFSKLQVPTSFGNTHDSRLWPNVTNFEREGRSIMLCSHAQADVLLATGVCIAFYSHERTRVYASHRSQPNNDLTLISILGDNASSPKINDFNWHTARRLVAVGNSGTVSAVIAFAENNLDPLHWTRW
jgi:hypothetical protein